MSSDGGGWVKVLKDGRSTILRIRGEGGLSVEIVFVGARAWATVRSMVDALNLPGNYAGTFPDAIPARIDVCPYNPEFYNERGPNDGKDKSK